MQESLQARQVQLPSLDFFSSYLGIGKIYKRLHKGRAKEGTEVLVVVVTEK